MYTRLRDIEILVQQKDGGARGGGRARRCGRFLIIRWCGVSRSGIRPSAFHLHSPHADLASLLSRGLGSFHGLLGLSIAFYPRVIGGIACTWPARVSTSLQRASAAGWMHCARLWPCPLHAGHRRCPLSSRTSSRHLRTDTVVGSRPDVIQYAMIGPAGVARDPARARVWVGDYRVQTLDCGSTNETLNLCLVQMGVRALWIDACMRERDIFEKFLDG
ncbi:hypothetical protein B0H13DRAFT_2345974 [Mycena leptocephala]|nr:hypothetical protein B0H13DRAFT_2345974 [Mycena leptocephala]